MRLENFVCSPYFTVSIPVFVLFGFFAVQCRRPKARRRIVPAFFIPCRLSVAQCVYVIWTFAGVGIQKMNSLPAKFSLVPGNFNQPFGNRLQGSKKPFHSR
jgi:hypothetical protein